MLLDLELEKLSNLCAAGSTGRPLAFAGRRRRTSLLSAPVLKLSPSATMRLEWTGMSPFLGQEMVCSIVV